MINELSQIAKKVDKDNYLIKEKAFEKEKAEELMVKVFTEHFSNLVNSMQSYNIKNLEHRKLIRGYIKTLQEDCRAIIGRMQDHHELAQHAKMVLKLVNSLDDNLRNHNSFKDNADFIISFRNHLLEYYNALRQDMQEIIKNDVALIQLIEKAQKA